MIFIRWFSRFCFFCMFIPVCFVSPIEKGIYTKLLSPKIVKTQYGSIRGALVEFKDPSLKPVASYPGLQFGYSLESQMRFMPPISPAEYWDAVRVVFKTRPVCPQKRVVEKNLEGTMPLGEVEKMKRLAHFVLKQEEECLTLNVFVPTGKRECMFLCNVSEYHCILMR